MCSRRGCGADPVFRIGDLSGAGVCPQHLVEVVAARLDAEEMEVVVVADHAERVHEIAACAA